ncbi:MAG TPA: GntR family transcriptional regulator [Euzebyales bacterium]|nr:GntR family transcriptional regulator [Euzebyales bacterium]
MSAVFDRRLRVDMVRDGLRDAILSGEFPPGAKLPNEQELTERFGVSRATVREAVRALVESAHLRRVHGSGTYVNNRPVLRNSLDTNFSYTDLIRTSGWQPGERCLALTEAPATPHAAELLNLPADAPTVRVERIRTADERPVIYSVDVLPRAVVGQDVPAEQLSSSLYRFLAAIGHPVHHGEARLVPVIADERLAEVLDVPQGAPLQYLEQTDFGADGSPLMLSAEWHVPDAIELTVYRRGPTP